MSIPGVGPVTALTFKAAVDDLNRFKSARTVAAHFGLTPRRFQSGEVDNPGHISRAGDADVRSALYVAAHSLLTRNAQWSTVKAWGARLAKTGGHRRSVIAVAQAGSDPGSHVDRRLGSASRYQGDVAQGLRAEA
jgi:transposase